MTDKLLQKLLEVSFPGLNIDAIKEVVNATPNPSVALETLLGIYEDPEIPETPGLYLTNMYTNRYNFKFISYDKFQNKVKYTFQEKESVSVYVKKDDTTMDYEKASKLPVVYRSYKDAFALHFGIPVSEVDAQYYKKTFYSDELLPTLREDTDSLERWLRKS